MRSCKARPTGKRVVKNYAVGGVTSIPCPNPPCPPDNSVANPVVRRMIESGAWELGPNGELMRVSVDDMQRTQYEKSRQQALRELAVEDPRTFAPTEVGFMTPERKAYLETRAGELTPEQAREYATVSFDPFEGPNMVFGFASSSTPVDPVGQIIGRGLTALGKGYKAIKNPKVLPIMDQARMEASIEGIRVHFGIELGHVVNGEVMTPEKMRQIVIKDLVGENASGERLARANQAIDQAIDEYMPKAIEKVMSRSEGNLLHVPVDTRHPQVDRVRMRFLSPNSKLWQQANKEGLIPVQNIKQSMKDMSEMEKYVLEEAIFSAPVYNKKGVLLQGEELRNAQDAIISAIARTGMGPSIEEAAEGIGDISEYKVNLNQLKGLSEATSATMNPVRSFELVQNGTDFFGSKIGVGLNEFKGDTYSTYGLERIGYVPFGQGVTSKTFVVGSDDLSSYENHFNRGELSHFRIFTDDAVPKPSDFFPGTTIDITPEFNKIRTGTPLGTGRLEWYQDMSRVPSGLGLKRGGNVVMPTTGSEIIKNQVESFLSSGGSSKSIASLSTGITNALRQLRDVNSDASKIASNINKVQSEAAKGEGSLVGPKGDNIIKKLFEFAKLPNRTELINQGTRETGGRHFNLTDSQTNNLVLDDLIKNLSKEEEILTRLGQNKIPEVVWGEAFPNIKNAERYFDQVYNVSETLSNSTLLRLDQNFRNYDWLIDTAKSDFAFGAWGREELADALDVLEGSVIPSAKNRFVDNMNNYRNNLSTLVIEQGAVPQVKNAAQNMRSRVRRIKDIGENYFNEMGELAKEAAFIQQKLRDEYIIALNNARERGVKENILGRTAAEELQPKIAKQLEELKETILKIDALRTSGIQAFNDAAMSMRGMSDDVARILPDLYEAAKVEMKNNLDNVMQDQTAIDYYDLLETQSAINNSVRDLREEVMSGNINNPELRSMFLDSPNKDRFFVSEIQSDFVQKSSGSKSGEIAVHSTPPKIGSGFKHTEKGSRAELDSFVKNWRTKTIQQAVLQGRKAGKNEILFPTYKTADKIQGWQGSKDTSQSGAGNRITYQSMDKHIQKATGIKPTKFTDSKGNEWWSIKLDPNQKYEFPDFKYGGKIRLRKK